MSRFGLKPEYLLNKKKYERGEEHYFPGTTKEEFDKILSGERVLTLNDGCYTLTDNLIHAVQKYSKRNAMGYRVKIGEVEKKVVVEGVLKNWTIPNFDVKIKWFTYEEMWKRIVNLGDGVKKFTSLKKFDKFCIYEETRYEWLMMAHAMWRHSIIITTAYANLGVKNLVYCLNKTKASTILLNVKQIPVIIENAEQLPHLKYLIYTDKPTKELPKSDEFEIISFDSVEKLGIENPIKEEDIDKPKADDYCVFMFTSGATGVPKGVMIKHSNIIPAAYCAKGQINVNENDIFIAYLPLAHILELEAECVVLFSGACLAFGSPFTLMDRGASPYGDIDAFKPSVMLGVPRVWDTVKKAVWEKVNAYCCLLKWITLKGYIAKKKALYNNTISRAWNKLLFNKFKKRFGGNIRLLATGAAPLSQSSQEFMAAIFDVPFVQGYGLTEVTGACLGQSSYEFSTDNCGYPIMSCKIKLVDVAEMGYLTTDEPNERGEVVIAGPNVTGGYFEEEERTAQSFKKDKDGTMWFYSGDIGEWFPDGTMKIIDRKKNLTKLSGGEYVAQAHLESLYASNHPWIAPNGMFVHADPTKDSIVAIVQLRKEHAFRYAEKWGYKLDVEFLANHVRVKKKILKKLHKIYLKCKLKKFERIANVRVTLDTWLPENGLVTASQKLRRRPLADKYKDVIDEMFAEISQGRVKDYSYIRI